MGGEIRRLEAGDDRLTFDSGCKKLDYYFRKHAWINHLERTGVCYVYVASGRIDGFVVVATGTVEKDKIPDVKLSRNKIPVVIIAQLAVRKICAGCGIGLELVRFAYERARETSHSVGCVGVIVDSWDSAVPFWTKRKFSPIPVSDRLPGLTSMARGIDAILADLDSA